MGRSEEYSHDKTEAHSEQPKEANSREIIDTTVTTDPEALPLKSTNTDQRKAPRNSCSKKYILPTLGIFITVVTLLIFSIHGKIFAMPETSDAKLSTPTAASLVAAPTAVTRESRLVDETPPSTIPFNNNKQIKTPRALSFFGKTKFSFGTVVSSKSAVSSNSVSEAGEAKYFINAEQFLVACNDYLVIYDLLGGATFKLITSDVNRNIEKLSGFQEKTKFENLFDIIQKEIDEDTTAVPNSATDALLWLKRGLWMMYYFFLEIVESDAKTTAPNAFKEAYQKTLAPHHKWYVSGLIQMGLTVAPSVAKFVDAVCKYKVSGDVYAEHNCMASISDPEERLTVVLSELDVYIKDMYTLLELIDEFYEHKLPQLKK